MSGLDHEEIIALTEDPDALPSEGRNPTAQEHAQLEKVALRAFRECAPDTQVDLILNGSRGFAARVLGVLSEDRRTDVLSRLPMEIAAQFADKPGESSV